MDTLKKIMLLALYMDNIPVGIQHFQGVILEKRKPKVQVFIPSSGFQTYLGKLFVKFFTRFLICEDGTYPLERCFKEATMKVQGCVDGREKAWGMGSIFCMSAQIW